MSKYYLDSLIESYLSRMAKVPDTVVEDGNRIFGTMSEPYRRMADEVARLCEVQREIGIVPYTER